MRGVVFRAVLSLFSPLIVALPRRIQRLLAALVKRDQKPVSEAWRARQQEKVTPSSHAGKEDAAVRCMYPEVRWVERTDSVDHSSGLRLIPTFDQQWRCSTSYRVRLIPLARSDGEAGGRGSKEMVALTRCSCRAIAGAVVLRLHPPRRRGALLLPT